MKNLVAPAIFLILITRRDPRVDGRLSILETQRAPRAGDTSPSRNTLQLDRRAGTIHQVIALVIARDISPTQRFTLVIITNDRFGSCSDSRPVGIGRRFDGTLVVLVLGIGVVASIRLNHCCCQKGEVHVREVMATWSDKPSLSPLSLHGRQGRCVLGS